jgi:hypothetical protein
MQNSNNKIKSKIFVFGIICVLVSALPAFAISLDPMRLGAGARSVSMGRTAAALTGNINSLFINPANAAYLPKWGLTSMYTSLLEGDITYTLLGGATKTGWGTFGLAYMGSGTSGIQTTTLSAGRVIAGGNAFDYANRVFSVVYGREIIENLAAGATLKFFSKEFGGVADASGTGYDLDLGIVWKPMKKLSVGLSQQNTLPFDMGGKIKWEKGTEEAIPSNTKLGLAYTPIYPLLVALDLDLAQDKPLVIHGGVEWKAMDFLAIRGGVEQTPTSNTETTTNFTAGVGFMFRDFGFDYCYYLDNVLKANSTHYFALSYAPAIPVVVAPAPPEVIIPVERAMFPDVPIGYWAREAIEFLARKKIITGYPDGTFKPERALTRAELCALLIRAKGYSVVTPKTAVFRDVATTHWAAAYIETAANLKLVEGYPNGTFKPNQALTREEAIKILVLFDNKTLPAEAPAYVYADVSGSRWSARYISVARSAGWLYFVKEKNLSPKKQFPRAEAAAILYLTSFVQGLK